MDKHLHVELSQEVECPQDIQKLPEVQTAALIEVMQRIELDCRSGAAQYLEEIYVLASGE